MLDRIKALCENSPGFLASEQLHFGVTIPGWSADTAAEWEQAYAAETQTSECGMQYGCPDRFDSDLPHSEDELENLVRLILKSASDRNFSVVVWFFGFDGTGKKTLEEVGQSIWRYQGENSPDHIKIHTARASQ